MIRVLACGTLYGAPKVHAMIERLSTNPDLGWYCETESYVDAKGESREMYRMDKDTTLTLVSGYDAVLRFRIIKRWQELESAPSGTFDLSAMTSAALRELAAKVEELATLKAKPKARDDGSQHRRSTRQPAPAGAGFDDLDEWQPS